MDGELGEWFATTKGVRQGDPISPTVFILYLERIMDKIDTSEKGIRIQGENVTDLRFADDVDMLDENSASLQITMEQMYNHGKNAGLLVNAEKTKTMMFGSKEVDKNLMLGGGELENVESFAYLGSTLT